MSPSPSPSDSHPCFSPQARRSAGRVHLPAAPQNLARLRFGAPAAKGTFLGPPAALSWLSRVINEGAPVEVVGITGPGDPLATLDRTVETLTMVGAKYPNLVLCLTCLGLGGQGAAPALAGLGLDHVTILMDALSVDVAQEIYAWIRPGTHTLPLAQGACILLEQQADAIAALAGQGITVKVNTTVYPGINSGQVEEIAQKAAGLGASVVRLIPWTPGAEREPDWPPAADESLMVDLMERAGRHLEVMAPRSGCGQDLVGLETQAPLEPGAGLPGPSPERPNLAVCSSNGFEVDLHLGQSNRYLIYGPQDGPVIMLDARPAPEPGLGPARWSKAAETLHDCFALLAAAAGEAPRRELGRAGIQVLIQEGNIESLVDLLYGGGRKKGGRPRG